MAVTAIGWRAHAALLGSGGRARVVAPLSTSFYADAAGELIWIGPPGTPLHARAVVLANPATPAAEETVRIVVDGVAPWRPARLHAPVYAGASRVLLDRLALIGEPRGFGRLLGSASADDVILARARPHARALAAACRADDPAAAAEAARSLLGLGAGLTPSGDDYVGGVLFAQRVRGRRETSAWEATIARLVTDAATLTHPISARLLADLADGEGWAPLHDLAAALVADAVDESVAAARALTRLGHTSGWDLLAGFLTALAAAPERG